jgi:hypothetical protein
MQANGSLFYGSTLTCIDSRSRRLSMIPASVVARKPSQRTRYVEGQNIALERRYGEAQAETEMAAELGPEEGRDRGDHQSDHPVSEERTKA